MSNIDRIEEVCHLDDHENYLRQQKMITRLITTMDSQPDCLKIISKDYKLLEMNIAGLKMIGAESMESVQGISVLKIVDDIYHDLYKDSVDAAFRGETMEIEYNITAIDGTKRRMSQRSAPIYSKQNPDEVIEMVAVTRDITEQYHTHMDLIEAKLAAEEAYRVKSNFLATMSHELRTPLNAILGFSEVIMNEQFGEIGNKKYSEYIKDIHSSGRHLLELINDVLDISEIEAKKRHYTKEEVSIQEVIFECIHTVSVIARKKKIKIGVDVSDDFPTIWADRRSIKQILINLLSNAIKFSYDNGQIYLSAKKNDAEVILSVKDTGVGISKESLKDITKPFYRVQENPQIASAGTGLGLSIVKTLLEAHNGSIDFKSKVGEGTIVTVTLPRVSD